MFAVFQETVKTEAAEKLASITAFKIFRTSNRDIRNVMCLLQMLPKFPELHLSDATNALDFSLRWDVSLHNSSHVNCRVVENVLTLFLYYTVYIPSLIGPAELLPGAKSLRTITGPDYEKRR